MNKLNDWKRELKRANELVGSTDLHKAHALVEEHGKPVEGWTPKGDRMLMTAIVISESSAATLLLGPCFRAVLVVPGKDGPIFMEDVPDWMRWAGGMHALDQLLEEMSEQSYPMKNPFRLLAAVAHDATTTSEKVSAN